MTLPLAVILSSILALVPAGIIIALDWHYSRHDRREKRMSKVD